jgi:CheY-like chemotaxis protein
VTRHPPANAGDSSARGPAGPPDGAGRVRLLVVDDEPAVGAAMRRIFAADHDVTVVYGGREAIEAIEAAPFDVVLCDVMMPDLTGVEVYEAVRAARPELAARFVFVTSGAFDDRCREILSSIPNPVVPKPFDATILRATIERVLAR